MLSIKQEKINEYHIKTALLCYFRFKRGALVATEVSFYGSNVCDIVADTGSLIYDVEIKISIADLKRDFLKYKHTVIDSKKHGNIPNYFYFCIPTWLAEKAVPIIKEANEAYGIFEYDPTRVTYYAPSEFIRVLHRGKKLKADYDHRLKDRIIMRSMSDLCRLYKKEYDVGEYLKAAGEEDDNIM